MPTITLMWDANTGPGWTEVRIYEGTTKVATAVGTATSATVTCTKAPHTWVARSWDGLDESLDSNAVVWAPPVPPGHLRR
jgi:hypothetical protein